MLDQGKPKKPSVEYKFLLVFTAFDRQFSWLTPLGPVFPAASNDREVLHQFYANLDQLSLRPPPVTTMEGRFDRILEGLDKLHKREVQGTKLVVDL